MKWLRRKTQRIRGKAAPGFDPRWETLAGSWACSKCNQLHDGLFDLACFCPDYWGDEEVYEPNSMIRMDSDFLSEDFCVVAGDHFFVRTVLELPLVDGPGHFAYGVWVSASRSNFELYLAHFDAGDFDDDAGWFGWFSNALSGYPDTVNLACNVELQRDRQRPKIILHETDHPLYQEQAHGVGYDRLKEIYELNGHSLKLS